jgi:hypothetical protein
MAGMLPQFLALAMLALVAIGILIGKNALIIIVMVVVCFALYKSKGKPIIALYLAIRDVLRRDKRKFRGYGFWLFCGLGGSGKTISMVEYLNRMRKKYPKLKIYTNFDYKYRDGDITSWQDLIDYDNGTDGIIFGFDEIHLTFASQNWKDCPDNMLDYISQQRKLCKQIIGSSQVFTRVDKKLREQTNYVVECKSAFQGRWVFNKAFLTDEYLANGDIGDKGQKKRNRAWRHNFIAYDNIRQSYNTMQLMKELKKGKTDKDIKRDEVRKALSEAI